MTRSDPKTRHRRLRPLQIRRARKEDREAIWQIFRAVVARGDTYVFDPNISRRKALAYWLGPKTRCYVALSDQGIVGSYILKANQPGLGSHVANAGFMVSPSARGRGIGRAMAEHCLHEARRLGFRAMQFNFVVATNRTALRLSSMCRAFRALFDMLCFSFCLLAYFDLLPRAIILPPLSEQFGARHVCGFIPHFPPYAQ